MKSVRSNVVVLAVLYTVALVVGLHFYTQKTAQDATDAAAAVTQAQLVKGCERANPLRGYLLIRGAELSKTSKGGPSVGPELAPLLFRIVNCPVTYAKGYIGPAVYLSDGDQACYLRLERAARWTATYSVSDPRLLRRICAD